jgi:hypothetical protein
VPSLIADTFHASSNTPESVVDSLADAIGGSCADMLALLENENGSASSACSGPAVASSTLTFYCVVN